MISNVLLVHVPSREGVGEGNLPLGLLYVGSALERLGINVKIFDMYLYELPRRERYGYYRLKKVIERFNPNMVGFGGIATSYTKTKALSNRIKKEYPQIMQVSGGALSSVYDLLLTKTAIDVVFHGEVEKNLPLFIERINEGDSYFEIPGISYIKESEIKRNPPAMQIENLDDIPFPSYHLIDVEKYIMYKEKLFAVYKNDMKFQGLYENIVEKLKDVDFFFPIITSRGCMYHCSFCYRHMHGYRKHSTDYIIQHIKLLKENFGINGFFFMDELFNGDEDWVMELCDAIENNNLSIAYRTSGGRVDKVSEEMLQHMYNTGCFNLNYGQESGSNKILKEYGKRISREKNIETTLLTRKCGIYSTVQLVIGSPGETKETIMETVDFLKEVGVRSFSLNYLIPLPGAPVWSFATKNNLIQDVEGYLHKVAKWEGAPIVNLTKAPNKEWENWGNFIRYKINLYHARRSGSILDYLNTIIKYQTKKIMTERLRQFLKRILGNLSFLK